MEKSCIVLLVILVLCPVIGKDLHQVSAKIKYNIYYNSKYDYRIKYPKEFTKMEHSQIDDGVWIWTEDKDAELTLSGGLNVWNDDGDSAYESSTNHSDKKHYSHRVGKDFVRESYREGKKCILLSLSYEKFSDGI